MIEFYVSGQSLKFFTPVIAADSLNYLTARVNFTGAEWEEYSKWLHFRQDEGLGAITYDLQLNDNNEITAEQKLNLTVGQWEIYLTGTREDSRLTTVPLILTVKESGLIDAPLHELPMSVAEQVDFNARQAILLAQAVKDAADAGDFDGKDGTSLAPLGHFSTVDELAAIITQPKGGDVYSVGVERPYELYVWDGINLEWRNHGQLQGVPGEKGEKGATFIPGVDANGNISWVNDGGLENPVTRNIRGPKGEDGAAGPEGPGAYEKAQEAGYTGTEATFYQALTMMPYHNRRHLPGGADPIVVETDNIKDGAVKADKIAEQDRTQYIAVEVSAEWMGEAAPYIQTIAVTGIRENDRPIVHFAPPEDFEMLEDEQEAYALLYDIDTFDGSIKLWAKELPESAFNITLEVARI